MIDNYRQLPIGKYLEILAVSQDDSIDAVTHQVRIIAILAEMTEDDVLNLPLPTYSDYALTSQFLSREYDGTPRMAKQYIAGIYTLIPCIDVRNMITAQYLDFQAFCNKGDSALIEVLSCFLIPKGCKYNQGYDIIDVQKAIREDLSTADALTLQAFFLLKSLASMRNILTSSRKMIRRLPNNQKRKEALKMLEAAETSISGGDGLPILMRYLKQGGSVGTL